MNEFIDAWDYGPGNFQDPGAWNAGWYGNAVDFSGSSSAWDNLLNGFGNILPKIATTATDVWAKKTLMEQNLAGQRYLMGQRAGYMTQPLGMNAGTLLLIGGGLLLFVLLKD